MAPGAPLVGMVLTEELIALSEVAQHINGVMDS
jgi:hypothetical protein